MKRPILLCFAVAGLCLCAVFCALRLSCAERSPELPDTATVPPASENAVDYRDYISCSYYDAELVRAHTTTAGPDDAYQNIAGAVVPHYAPAMYMVSDILSSVGFSPDTVVVVAPNHAGKGIPVQVCGRGYYWKSGTIAGDQSLAKRIATGLDIETDDTAAQEDWSASLLMPYVAQYFPDAHVVTVLLSRGAGEAQVLALADCLAEISETQEILVLGSADFSHYQDEQTAHNCDTETARVIAAGNRAQLLSLGNEYLDSPETVAVLLEYASLLGHEFSAADSMFETFVQDGRRVAGSYYAYVVK